MSQARQIILPVVLLLVVGITAFYLSRGKQVEPSPENHASISKIGIFLFAQHPIIEEIRIGAISSLDKLAKAKEIHIEYIEKNADGDATQNQAIATYFKSSGVDAVITIGLPSAQAMKSAQADLPVVFGGPPDPIGAGLVPSLVDHGTNFTGTRYFPPVENVLEVFNAAFPETNSVAVLHNPGEANSMAVVRAFISSAKDAGLAVHDITATNAMEIEAALRRIASLKQPLFIPTDNLVYSNLDRVTAVANQNEIPVFNCTKLSVEKGATFSVATNYIRVGVLTGDIAGRIVFAGEKPQDIDVLDIKEGSIFVNSRSTFASSIQEIEGYPLKMVP